MEYIKAYSFQGPGIAEVEADHGPVGRRRVPGMEALEVVACSGGGAPLDLHSQGSAEHRCRVGVPEVELVPGVAVVAETRDRPAPAGPVGEARAEEAGG